ncbi:hypothetical protein BH23GEM9_BH23GEM9_16300 [soil metagenome]
MTALAPAAVTRLAAAVIVTSLGTACGPRGVTVPAPPAAPTPSAAAAFADADDVRTTAIAPGVTHAVVHDARGPWAIHIVDIDAAVCRPALEARKPGGPLSARATTSRLGAGALIAVNADFFRIPGGTPVGAHVSGGVPFIGPTDWPVFAVTTAGEWRSGTARVDGHVHAGADTARLAQINRTSEQFTAWRGVTHGVTLFTGRADTVPADTAARRLTLRLLHGDERAGRGIVMSNDSPAATVVVQSGAAALYAYGSARDWARRRGAGDTVAWRARVVLRPVALVDDAAAAIRRDTARSVALDAEVDEVVGAFPELLRNGSDVLGNQAVRDDFGQRRHPRTAIGWTADGRRLFIVVVDGRQPSYSDGMTLPEMIWLFRRLGAAHAVNLDGGGSTAMVIGGRLINRPSDAQGEREVGNALAVAHCMRDY